MTATARGWSRRRWTIAGIATSLLLALVVVRRHIGAPQVAPQKHELAIRGMEFSPATLEAAVGDTLVWTNHDLVPHTATASHEQWDTGTLEQGASGTVVLGTRGATTYFCRLHPTMTGTVVVR